VRHLAPLAGGDGSRDDIPLLGDLQLAFGKLSSWLSAHRLVIHLYGGFLASTAVVLGATFVTTGSDLNGPFWALTLLALFALAAEQQPVRLSANSEVTVSMLPVLFAAVAFGPLAAMLVGALGLVGDLRRPYTRWVIWTSQRAIVGALAALAAAFVSRGSSFGDIAAAVVLGFVAYAVFDALLAAMVIHIRRAGSPVTFLRSALGVMGLIVPLYTPVVIMLIYAYREVSVWTILLFFAPAFAAQSLYRLYREQREVTQELQRANHRLERANLSFAGALVAALDARDRYTAGHSAAVAVYARDIAIVLGLSEEDQRAAHLCGLVHDIGKVGLPAGILEKQGPLTAAERVVVEDHSVIGERILANVEDYAETARIVRHHHERIDGTGYPDGLSGDSIPLVSRIIAVADAYNAMTSERPYRDAMPTLIARERLTQAAGSQFDPSVVKAFEAILKAASDAYRMGLASEFHAETNGLASPILRPVPDACVA
jgi:putative nucleotidyltransferase with HDIG domain